MGIDDQHAQPRPAGCLQIRPQAGSGGVRVFWQQEHPFLLVVALPGDVGVVDAGVGADETQAVLDDDRAGAGAQHRVALAQHQLDQPGVLIDLRRQLERRGRKAVIPTRLTRRPSDLDTAF